MRGCQRASEQFVGIDAFVDEFLDALHGGFTVGSVGDAEPLRCGVKYLDGGRAIVDELADHERDEELSLQVLDVLRVGEELLEVSLGVKPHIFIETGTFSSSGCHSPCSSLKQMALSLSA